MGIFVIDLQELETSCWFSRQRGTGGCKRLSAQTFDYPYSLTRSFPNQCMIYHGTRSYDWLVEVRRKQGKSLTLDRIEKVAADKK